jgi:hypothetical protein
MSRADPLDRWPDFAGTTGAGLEKGPTEYRDQSCARLTWGIA